MSQSSESHNWEGNYFYKKINTYKLNLNEWFIQLEAYTCYQAKSNYLPNLEPNPSPPHSVDNLPPPSVVSLCLVSTIYTFLIHAGKLHLIWWKVHWDAYHVLSFESN